MHTIFHLTRDIVIRVGLVITLLGLVWTAVSVQVWSRRGYRFVPARDANTGEWYVTKVGAAITVAVGVAIFGFGLTM